MGNAHLKLPLLLLLLVALLCRHDCRRQVSQMLCPQKHVQEQLCQGIMLHGMQHVPQLAS
jgi:hypothetical protein